jgi:hypothetical protein
MFKKIGPQIEESMGCGMPGYKVGDQMIGHHAQR